MSVFPGSDGFTTVTSHLQLPPVGISHRPAVTISSPNPIPLVSQTVKTSQGDGGVAETVGVGDVVGALHGSWIGKSSPNGFPFSSCGDLMVATQLQPPPVGMLHSVKSTNPPIPGGALSSRASLSHSVNVSQGDPPGVVVGDGVGDGDGCTQLCGNVINPPFTLTVTSQSQPPILGSGWLH